MADVQQIPALWRIPIERVLPGPNARGDVGDVTELAASIRTIGLQVPILVRAFNDGDQYEVIDGHRRHAAVIKLGLPHIDAVIRAARPDACGLTARQLAISAHAKPFDPILAAAAHMPGGVTFAGRHWCLNHPGVAAAPGQYPDPHGCSTRKDHANPGRGPDPDQPSRLATVTTITPTEVL